MEVVLDLKACPYCEVEDFGVMHKIVSDQIALGKIREGVFGAMATSVFTTIDATRPPIAGARIPAIKVYSDLCKKCGRAANSRIEKGHATMPLRPGDPPIFQ